VKTLLAAAVSALLLAGCGQAAPSSPANRVEAVSAPAPANRIEAAPAPAEAGMPALTGRVVDRANLLSPAEEASLTAELAALERRTSDQLVIVTTPSLDGRTIEAFGLALANHWGVGQRGKDNGVLLIVAPNERRTRIEVGYGLEAILTDERAQQIVDRELVPRFRDQMWSEGIGAGARAIAQMLVAHEREPRRRQR